MRLFLLLSLLSAASGLRLSKLETARLQRRATLSTAFAAAASLLPKSAAAESQLEAGGALGATCLGFGCNPYGRPDFNGIENAPPGSLPYPEFLEAVKAKKVTGVVFKPPAGNEAYALIDGKSVRIGEGWPVEVGNSWSSPQWVVRILRAPSCLDLETSGLTRSYGENNEIPYAWDFDLETPLKTGVKKYPKPGEKAPAKVYLPTPSPLSVMRPDATNALGVPPKMYGVGD